MNGRTTSLTSALAVAILIAGLDADSATGQAPLLQNLQPGQAAEEFAGKVHLPLDRTSTRGIQRAQRSIAKGEFSQAILFLDEILARDEDIFVQLGRGAGIRGLKETARQMIRDLPPEGRRAYETAYGPVALRLLREAVARGDVAAIEQIAHRYFYTPAGYEAAFLCAMEEADAGRHLSAALTLEQLLDTAEAAKQFGPQLSVRAATSWLAAGETDKARQALEAVIANGGQRVRIADREYRLDAGGDLLQWLRSTVGTPLQPTTAAERHWITFRGNAARNGAASGGLPHMRVRWDVQLLGPLGPPKLETTFDNLAADLVRSGDIVPVASSPLAVGDYVLTRTLEGLLAVDFRTGKRVWRSEPQREPQIESLIDAGATAGSQNSRPELVQSFARRMWEDYLYGLLSSDGSRVYMIRDLAMPAAQDFEMAQFMGAAAVADSRTTNCLSAYELATQGKLVWEIDGAVDTGELAGAFFLGVPVAVGQSLYVIAEIPGAGVYLAALEAATGQLQWRQQLAVLETGVVHDTRRRLQASMPSYQGGILVCPTGAGVVVGVDLAKRSLAWAYRYETSPTPDHHYRGRADANADKAAHRWLDNAATIIGGRVLLTPPESPHLHCVDLRTGRVLWRQTRNDMLRLACVEDGRILLTGNRKLTALKLEDGKPVWPKKTLVLPRDASPSGAGFASEGRYFLPLTTGEVLSIDLSEGRIVAKAVAPDGVPLGNLICHRGSVISQSGRSLDCFDQVDVLRDRSERALKDDPANIDALRTLGEIAYNEGRLSDAIAMLERAHQASPDDLATRDVLAECLAAALDSDFASYRNHMPLLKKLDDGSTARRMHVLRIESQGLLAAGETLGAADACFDLYRLAGAPDELLEVRRDYHVAVGRWVQAQLAAIWRQGSEKDRSIVKSEIKSQIDSLGESPDLQDVSRIVEFFGAIDAAEPVRLLQARQLDAQGDLLRAQQILLDLVESSDAAIRGEALARLASQLHAQQLDTLAAEFDRQLLADFSDVECLQGATGAQLVAQWTERAGNRLAPWPQGAVEVRNVAASGTTAASRSRSPLWGIRLEHCDSILGLASGQYASRGGELVLQDNVGHEFFRTALDADSQLQYRQAGSIYGASRGNLLVLSLGRQLVAVNALPSSDGLSTPVLWRANLASHLETNDPYGAEPSFNAASRPGSYRAPRAMTDGKTKWVGVIGPITAHGCIYQDQRRFACVDAITGETRWSRTDVPQGCDLFGDGEIVVAVPAGSTTGQAFSTVDGRLLGEVEVSPWQEQLITVGRSVVQWKRVDGGRMELASLDAMSGDVQWRREYSSAAKVDVDAGRFAAVVEPAGLVEIIDLEDGASVVSEQYVAGSVVEEIHLAVGADSFTLVAKYARRGGAKRNVHPFNPVDSAVIDGDVYRFDRATGEMLWNRPAEVVQQALLLTQPVDAPFLVFAGTVNRGDSGTRTAANMLILDKATGRTLFQSDELPQVGAGQCVVTLPDPNKRAATVEMPGCTILLQFTDKRRPPAPPAMAEVESDAGQSSRGLLGIFFGGS